jgi:hypothetical protein
MGATEDFLAEMQKRRQMQMQHIQQLFGRNEAPSLSMAPASTRPGFVGNIIRSVTGLVSGNALQAGAKAGQGALTGLNSLAGGFSNTLPVSAGAKSFLAAEGAPIPEGLQTAGSGVLGGLQGAGNALGTALGTTATSVGNGAVAAIASLIKLL